MTLIVQSEAVPATERDNRWYLFDSIFFSQLTDTDTRINKTDKNAHSLVKEVRCTALNHPIEPPLLFSSDLTFYSPFVFCRSNVSFYITLFLIYG